MPKRQTKPKFKYIPPTTERVNPEELQKGDIVHHGWFYVIAKRRGKRIWWQCGRYIDSQFVGSGPIEIALTKTFHKVLLPPRMERIKVHKKRRKK